MKSRIWILTILTVIGTAQAFAAFNDTSSLRTASGFEALKIQVQAKINALLDYWNGTEQASKPLVKTVPVSPLKTAAAPVVSSVKPSVLAATSGAPVTTPAPSIEKGPSQLQTMKDLREKLKSKDLLKISKAGRAGSSPLAKSKAGVPLANWKSLKVSKKIPRLDIGVENSVSREDFEIEKLKWSAQKPQELKPLPVAHPIDGQQLKSLISSPVAKVTSPRGLQPNFRTVGQPVSREVVAKIQYSLQSVPEVQLRPYNPLPEETLKMVAALILFEKGGSCHMIMGLFSALAEAPRTKMEATYHLGACADQLQMNQAAFDKLSSVVAAADKDFSANALSLLARDLPPIYEKEFFKLLKGMKSLKGLTQEEAQDHISYRMAKGAYRSGDYKTSLDYADRVSASSEFKDDARVLSSMNSFALGDKASALKKLEDLKASFEARKVQDSNLKALVNVNLARMNFAQKKYSRALENYMQVPKDHPLWVTALIEQGWTQVATEDYSGAIGNMYSLHSPYFKAVYQPESFVVRTIGYLNICQYGDAYKSLSWLEKDYREWSQKLEGYMTSQNQPQQLYATVKNYIRGKSTDDVDGVPHQVWREMARRKDFLNVQTALNDKFDESKRYEGVNEKIKNEKAGIRWRAEQAKKRFDQLKVQITQAKQSRAVGQVEQLTNSLKLERDLTLGLRFQLAILEWSRQGYLNYQKTSQAKLDQETAGLSLKAGQLLIDRAQAIRTEMARVLENNEFLRYEVFAGSGENIRYQVTGGAVGNSNRVPAHIKPTKMLNWSFDGEYWADEIGSYRSSLRDVCPTTQHGQNRGAREGDQASLDVN